MSSCGRAVTCRCRNIAEIGGRSVEGRRKSNGRRDRRRRGRFGKNNVTWPGRFVPILRQPTHGSFARQSAWRLASSETTDCSPSAFADDEPVSKRPI